MQYQLTVDDGRAKTECRRLTRLLFGSGKRTVSRVTEERPAQTDPTPTFTSAECPSARAIPADGSELAG